MFKKAIAFLAVHVAAVLAQSAPAASSAPSPAQAAAQAAFDAAKPLLSNAIDQTADQLAAEVDTKGAPGISNLLITLNGKIAGMQIPNYVKVGLELAVATASLSTDRVTSQGKAAIYAEAARLKGLVSAARL